MKLSALIHPAELTPVRNLLSPILLAFATTLGTHAAVTYELAIGAMRDVSGTALPDSTLVVLIANTNGASGLPGGLNDSDLSQSGLNPTNAFAHFAGQTLEVGDTINGDTVFYVGQINSTPNSFPAGMLYAPNLNFPSYTNGLAQGQSFGVYWFPGITSGATPLPTGSFQIGGFFNSAPNTDSSDIGMVLQDSNSGSNWKAYQMDSTTAAGGFGLSSSTAPAAFTAILVPEPSAALLGALAALLGLRRRR